MISFSLKSRSITIRRTLISPLKIKMITIISIIIIYFTIRISKINCAKKMIFRIRNISTEWIITHKMQCSSISNSKPNKSNFREINNRYTLQQPVRTQSASEISIISTFPSKGSRGSSPSNSRKKILSSLGERV